MCIARYIIHVYVYKYIYIHIYMYATLFPCRTTVRHNDPRVTGGPRLYLRVTVEINETKTGTLAAKCVVSCREVGPSTTVSDFTYRMWKLCRWRGPLIASRHLASCETYVVLLSCCFPSGFELKRKRRAGHIEAKLGKVDKDVIYIKLSKNQIISMIKM